MKHTAFVLNSMIFNGKTKSVSAVSLPTPKGINGKFHFICIIQQLIDLKFDKVLI